MSKHRCTQTTETPRSIPYARVVLYIHTVIVKVYLGYADGVAKPSVWSGPPLYGQMVSDNFRGIQRLELWPIDFPMHIKASTTNTVKPWCLWKPEVSVVLENAVAFSGLERVGRRWVVQRWMCEPTTVAQIGEELRDDEMRRPREVAPFEPPSQRASCTAGPSSGS